MRNPESTSKTRRSALAGVLVLLSLIAHAGAAGSLPGGPALLGAVLVATAISWSLSERRRSIPVLLAIIFAGQLLIHAVVVALGHHGVSYLPDSSMVLAHLAAAAIAAVIFARAEQIAAAWARATARMLGIRKLSALPISHTPSLFVDYRTVVTDPADMNVSSWRGPPVASGASTFA